MNSIIVVNRNPIFDSRNSCNAIIRTNSNTLVAGCNYTVIPNSVTNIGDEAFDSCSGMTSITIPEGVRSVGKSSFSGCSGLTSVSIPSSVTSIGYNPFEGCTHLTKAEFASIESLVEIDFVSDDSNPLSYAHHLYIAGEEILDLVIPEGVTNIGNYSFYNAKYLNSVTIPANVKIIGKRAFSGCSGLKTINSSSASP